MLKSFLEAVDRLEASESSDVLKTPVWAENIRQLEASRASAETLGLSTFALLTSQILTALQPLHQGVLSAGPSRLQTLGRALKKWVQLRDQLATSPVDPEVQTVLRSLGAEVVEAPSAPAPAVSTTFVTDMAKYLPLFVEETEEGIEIIQNQLLNWDDRIRKPGFAATPETVHELFRHAHKLKASAAAMGFNQLAELTHTLETVLDKIRGGSLKPNPELVTTLLGAMDHVRNEVGVAKTGRVPTADLLAVRASLTWYLDTPPESKLQPTLQEAIAVIPTLPLTDLEREKVNQALDQGQLAYRVTLKVRSGIPAPEMRLFLAATRLGHVGLVLSSTTPVDDLENKADLDFLSLTVSSQEKEDVIRQAVHDAEMEFVGIEMLKQEVVLDTPMHAPSVQNFQSIRVSVGRLDELMNLSGELSISKNAFNAISQRFRQGTAASQMDKISILLEEAISQLSMLVGAIQQSVLEMRMVPVLPLFERSRRMVRDLATEMGKEVELIFKGAETSLDKKIVDQLGDPLNHMVRNSVDHGLEQPKEREQAGKPRHGTVSLEAQREGSRIVITISDDGRGLPMDQIRQRAVEMGLETSESAAKLTEKDLIEYVFSPGFSTAKTVTHISGRGVGMDIVRQRIEEINGTVEVHSKHGHGTRIRISLPLTVVSQNCLLFDIHGVTFAIALQNISEILRIQPKELLDMKFGKFVRLRNEMIPVFRLKHFFRNTPFTLREGPTLSVNLVIVHAGKKRLGLIVDELRGEEEMLVKHPGELVGEIPGLAGVSVLSSGSVALILDVEKLVEKSDVQTGESHDEFEAAAAG